ncbi:hypothetical protein [Ancylomarina sp. 16SWW S1-10-2]|uniref:hypothetical protein n=1 Tax=Ancylomarina sp. 16SWW S1-10-2 TaxID=2499681 RepID=UPI0012ADFD05|nr:hypothetical protein [Ancylomarina sp. 16SWW S1-10-2]MRT92394.1 hypothetical protein [Ancylomarina sp. 16SWW S1-10-2]
MNISEPLRVIVELDNKLVESNEYIPLIVTSVITILIAVLTSWLMRKNELAKIKSDQDNLSRQIDSDFKRIFLAIESDNYRELYNRKLEALKKIKALQFTIIETTTAEGESYSSLDEYLQCFDFGSLKLGLYELILEYSCIFNNSIVDKMKSVYNDVDFTQANYDPDSSHWREFDERVSADFITLVDLVSKDLNIDYKDLKQKIK